MNPFFDFMVGQKIPVNLIESRSVEVALATLSTYLSFDIFDNVEFPAQPMLSLDFLFSRLTSTKLARHISSVSAYTVVMIRLPSSLNRQIT
jgi:hypothetical protein